ncbi:MAG: outer-membrane lipoprotein carrier protein LolA [Candidatus Azobacteroides sp.]|nr:outer-membrane lipoprotein carrier protein LolA [Candidatus Azobacteroides sp.]
MKIIPSATAFSLRILRYLPIILIGWFITAPAVAQKDAKAKELLDKSSAVLNQSGGLSVSFTFYINDEAHKIKQSFDGQMLIKGTKFFLETPEQTVYFDGKTQWVYNKSIEEVSILEPQPQDIQTLNPISTFELYKTGYDYKYQGEKTDIQNRKVQEISLFPVNKKDDIRQVDVQIYTGDQMPVFFRIIYKNKAEYRIHVNKYQTRLNFSDNQFVFDTKKYPQAEINDLR